VLHQGGYRKPQKQCPDLVTGKVVRNDPILSHKRTFFCLFTPAKPEVLNRKIAKIQCATGCKKAGYLTSQLSAPLKRKVTGDMGCIDDVEGPVAKRVFPYIRNKDTGLVRRCTGVAAKHCSVERDIKSGHRIPVFYQGQYGFTIPATKFKDTGGPRQTGKGRDTAAPEPSATLVIIIPGILFRCHEVDTGISSIDIYSPVF
jgi:hypothetical protein